MLDVSVRRRLGELAINVSFSSNAGVTALFGRSGAGKTSVINMIAGLLTPDNGRIVVGGRVLYDSDAGVDLPPRERRVGYVFQEDRLFPHMSVRANLRYAGRVTEGADFDHVVELLGLDGLLDRRPANLSGGEKQRVAIGRAVLARPHLLLMDEPLASLDAARKADILPYVERLRDDPGIPIVYVSHSIEEVSRLADKVVLMADGAVVADGSAEDVLGRLDLMTLAGRFQAGSLIETVIGGHDRDDGLTRLDFAGGTLLVPSIPLPVGEAVRIRVRARDVALATHEPKGLSIRNVLPATVVELPAQEGPFQTLKLDIGGASLNASITRQAARELDLAVGASVFALVKSVAIDRRSLGLPPRVEALP